MGLDVGGLRQLEVGGDHFLVDFEFARNSRQVAIGLDANGAGEAKIVLRREPVLAVGGRESIGPMPAGHGFVRSPGHDAKLFDRPFRLRIDHATQHDQTRRRLENVFVAASDERFVLQDHAAGGQQIDLNEILGCLVPLPDTILVSHRLQTVEGKIRSPVAPATESEPCPRNRPAALIDHAQANLPARL